jgi:hypothetical protein
LRWPTHRADAAPSSDIPFAFELTVPLPRRTDIGGTPNRDAVNPHLDPEAQRQYEA